MQPIGDALKPIQAASSTERYITMTNALTRAGHGLTLQKNAW